MLGGRGRKKRFGMARIFGGSASLLQNENYTEKRDVMEQERLVCKNPVKCSANDESTQQAVEVAKLGAKQIEKTGLIKSGISPGQAAGCTFRRRGG